VRLEIIPFMGNKMFFKPGKHIVLILYQISLSVGIYRWDRNPSQPPLILRGGVKISLPFAKGGCPMRAEIESLS
jgi:hypothetical protein